MIPARLITFINDEADMVLMGTRDADNKPNVHRVLGFMASDDGKKITAYVPKFAVPGLADAIANSGRVAMTVGHAVSHETYQIKGTAEAPAEPTDTHLAHFAKYLERLIQGAAKYGIPEQAIRMICQPPERTVTIAVEDLFLQTPGPGAGTRFEEEEGA